MKKAIRLTAKQAERYEIIKAYFKNVDDMLEIGDNDIIQASCIDKIDVLKTVINVYYYSFSRGRKVKEQIEKSDINVIYRKALKQDETFKIFVDGYFGKKLKSISERTALSHSLAEQCLQVFNEYEESVLDEKLFYVIDDFLIKNYSSKD